MHSVHMMHSHILQPVAVLIAWTVVMLGWLMAVRLPAMRAKGVDIRKLVGGRGADADGVLPAQAQWKAHNYNHLLEQPTIFYAVTLLIAVTGNGNGYSAWVAWGYVAIRIAHSIWQATVNRVSIRFALFIASSVCLAALAIHALRIVF